MSGTQQPTQDTDDNDLDQEALATQLEILRDENERLREEYARAKQTSYRRAAIALAAIGCFSVLFGIVLNGVRDVLFVLGAIGIFGGVLTWYLTPERVLTVSVNDSLYAAHAANGARLRDELGLQQTPVYTPSVDGVRLVLPQHREFSLPDTIDKTFLASDDTRGLVLVPAGDALYTDFTQTQGSPPTSLRETVIQLGDAVVEQFEIADAVETTATDDGRIVVSIDGAAFGSVTDFDHPAVSLLACGIAATQDETLAVHSVDESTVAFDTNVPPIHRK